MSAAKTYHRRTYVVDRRFQLKYTGLIVLIGAVIAFVAAYFIFQSWKENTELLALTMPDLAGTIQEREAGKIYWAVGIFVVLEIAGLFAWGILITHRIAGPLYIIDRYLEAIRSGFYPDMRPLRTHDELQQFFSSFSSTIDGLRQRELNELSVIEQALEALPAGEVRQALQTVRDAKNEFVRKPTEGDKSSEEQN